MGYGCSAARNTRRGTTTVRGGCLGYLPHNGCGPAAAHVTCGPYIRGARSRTMGARLLPRNLPELFSYSLLLEREAARHYAELERFLRGHGASALAAEFEKLSREERELNEVIALGTA